MCCYLAGELSAFGPLNVAKQADGNFFRYDGYVPSDRFGGTKYPVYLHGMVLNRDEGVTVVGEEHSDADHPTLVTADAKWDELSRLPKPTIANVHRPKLELRYLGRTDGTNT